MPWQMAPPLIIIAGAFTLTGVGLNAVHKAAHGTVKRVRTDDWLYKLEHRHVIRQLDKQHVQELEEALEKAKQRGAAPTTSSSK